jgi:uncharacterized protein YmfQ (DUF2313 family)
MARTPDQVQLELLALLTDGWVMPHEVDSYIGAMYLPDADAISSAEASMEALLPEIDPRLAFNLLPDYERVLGPDPCGRDFLALSDADRRALAWQRWTAGGDMCAGYLIAQAAGVGVTITIEEFQTFQCGRAQCGDELVSDPEQFTILVTLPSTRTTIFETGVAEAGDLLGDFTASLAECVVTDQLPLHIVPYFSYTS